jgi:hypothetical protein
VTFEVDHVFEQAEKVEKILREIAPAATVVRAESADGEEEEGGEEEEEEEEDGEEGK